MPQPYQQYYESLRQLVDERLADQFHDPAHPEALRQAVHYSLTAAGKRLRPVLVLMAADVCEGDREQAIPAACGLEMIHTYSLIHDDLPAMDDDALRRGRPTSHIVFGEALAILAGDALLTRAFGVVAEAPATPQTTAECLRILATAAGGAGMVGGQVLDLEAERGLFPGVEDATDGENPPSDRSDSTSPADSSLQADNATDSVVSSVAADPDVDKLIRIHRMKTGALITAALELGAVVAEADEDARNRLRTYGECCGLAFQIADDLLDVTGSGDRLGKETGRDHQLGKLTYPALLGIEGSRHKADELVRKACDALSVFGDKADPLRRLAQFIVERDH